MSHASKRVRAASNPGTAAGRIRECPVSREPEQSRAYGLRIKGANVLYRARSKLSSPSRSAHLSAEVCASPRSRAQCPCFRDIRPGQAQVLRHSA